VYEVNKMKVGILSGGGDAPGINAVIRAVVRKGILRYKCEMVGIKDGWKGLLEEDFMPLTLTAIRGILHLGGSILGTSRTNPFKREDGPQKIFENVKKLNIEAVVVIGGAHRRVMIVEVMGRYTGWIALEAGIAGGADIILIPEQPFDIDEVCEHIKRRQERGANFSVVVVAEGAKPKGGAEITYGDSVDEFGHVRLGGVGYYLGREIEKCTDVETRVVMLGHVQRGGSPTAFDRILATRYGIAAIDLVNQGKFGVMVALKGNKIVSVPLEDVICKRKTVDPKLYEMSTVFFG